MNTKCKSASILATVVFGAVLMTGCQAPETRAAPVSTVAPEKGLTKSPSSGGGDWSHSTIAVPTGDKSSSVILLDRAAPAEVSVGQPFNADITVTNLTANPLNAVMVTDQCAANFKLDSSDPATVKAASGINQWSIGTLGPHESKVIKIRGSASDLGVMKNCMSVTYDQNTCLAINVVQPKLDLVSTAPVEVLKCDNIPVKYVVTNSGTGTARNVVIRNNLPDNALTSDGKKSVMATVGDLPAGESRTINAILRATDLNKITNSSTATADGNLKSDASTDTLVKAPILQLTSSGTERIYAGRQATIDLTLTNKGTGDARDAILENIIPAGATFVSATSRATADKDGKIVWNVGTIKPGDSVKASVTYRAESMGTLEDVANAKAYCATQTTASVKTRVEGLAAILLEMVDANDPIEIGNVETYIVTITNQGSVPNTHVKVVCELESSMEFSSCSGATSGTSDGKVVTFEALGSLAPKAKAVWTVKVKAVKEGDVRFKTVLTSDQLTRPVEKTEATTFYK